MAEADDWAIEEGFELVEVEIRVSRGGDKRRNKSLSPKKSSPTLL